MCYKKNKVQELVSDTEISSLAPKILTTEKDLERVKPYLDLLKKTIDAPGVTNIALTGNYGSGKSTIINTFQSQHKEYEYLRISLASFGNVSKGVAEVEDEVKNSNPELAPKVTTLGSNTKKNNSLRSEELLNKKKEELERLLEVSILQQIFYHVKPSAIPDSRFKRITNIKDAKIFWIAFSFVLWLVSAFILFKFDYISRINPSSWNLDLSFDWWALPVFCIFFTGVGLFAKSIVRLLNNSKINKVNIKGELELGDKLDKSIFNEHLEEILYFFERTRFNLVVIEDLDRFDSTDIFTKLRELNTLLNNSLSIKERKGHQEIVFLYAISDETFKDKNERVKFFEYIIPIIPFINPSNAGEQLAKLIKEANIVDANFKDFTEDLVTFIDDIDMRLLINIFHEYQLYRENLSNAIQQDKLFAIITYKNIFPEDFSKLHNRKGALYDFISGRDIYVKQILEKIDNQISENKAEIKNISSIKVDDIEGLKALYIKQIYGGFSGAVGIKNGNSIINFTQLLNDENFSDFSKSKKIEYSYLEYDRSYGMYHEKTIITNTSFADLEEIVNSGFTYAERVQQILDVGDGRELELKEENDKLLIRKQDIMSWSFREIFEEVEIDPHITNFSDNLLIKNLLVNGYIDENYPDYISLFHGVNMSAEDFTFEKHVKSGIITAFDYKLNSKEYIIKNLNEKYFRREVILNLDLVSFLIINETSYFDKCSKIFHLLANEKERSLSFIDEFISKRTDEAGSFIRLLAGNWHGCWNYIENKSGYGPTKLNNYLFLLTAYAEIDDLIGQGRSMVNYISKKADFLEMFATDNEINSAKNAISKLGVKFLVLEPPKIKTEILFNVVYTNSYYQINKANIALMLKEQANGITDIEIKSSNYSIIQKSECEYLKKYVEDNINTYVKEVFLKIPENTKEEEYKVLSLLNNQKVDYELKLAIINGEYIMVSNLSDINDFNLQQQVVKNNRMNVIWNNIFTYYISTVSTDEDVDTGFDETLLDYLNLDENYLKLSTQALEVDDIYDQSFISAFIVEIMMCNELEEEAYFALMGSHSYSFDREEMENLDENKVKWIVANNKIELNKHTFDQLKEHFTGQQVKLIEQQQVKLEEQLDELLIDDDDSISLLGSKILTKENKLLIFNQLQDQTIINSPTISKLSCHLLSSSPDVDVSYPVIKSLFSSTSSTEEKINLLNIHFLKLSSDQIQDLLVSLKGQYEEIFIKRHKPKFSKNSFHNELFTKLKERQMILKFEPYEKDGSLWRVFANY